MHYEPVRFLAGHAASELLRRLLGRRAFGRIPMPNPSGADLEAAPFDLAAGRVTGPPIAIGGAVATDVQFYLAGISASANGTLAVRPPPAVVFPESNALKTELRLVDRSGTGSRVATARLFSYFMATAACSPPRSKTYVPARRTCRWWISRKTAPSQ